MQTNTVYFCIENDSIENEMKDEKGWIHYDVDINENQILEKELNGMISELTRRGHKLKSQQEGRGNIVVEYRGKVLNESDTLVKQGVAPKEVLRIGIKPQYLLQIQDGDQRRDINQKGEELQDGSNIIVGSTKLRFHIKDQQKRFKRDKSFFLRLQKSLSYHQTLYFMSLVGGIAGLLCWFVVSWIPFLWIIQSAVVDVINLTILGAFIGGLTIGFNDHWLGDCVIFRWVLVGILIGSFAGVIGGLIALPIQVGLVEKIRWLAILLLWAIGGALIGFGISLRWYSINKIRVLHGLTGGLFGGMLGGIIFWLLPIIGIPADISQALGFILTGFGITFGISIAPIILRQGILEFVTSGDYKMLKTFGKDKKKHWPIGDGDEVVIGSMSFVISKRLMGPEVQIVIPDHLVAPQHAILTARKNRYFIKSHPKLERFDLDFLCG